MGYCVTTTSRRRNSFLSTKFPFTMMAGGFTPTANAAGADEQALLDGLKAKIEEQVGKALESLTAVTYKTQVVAGTNYMIEAKCGEEFFHVKIFKPLPHTNAPAEVTSVSGPHTAGTAY